ncbi:MAG: OmpA family protein [Planctomycetota bacterium]|nr:OmpA family protein [Planctomycetota bacterium]
MDARRGVLATLFLLTTTLGACGNKEAQRVELLEQENLDLRNRAAQLQSRLDDTEADLALSEQERLAMQAEADRLRSEASRPNARGSTGFEGLSGVQSSVTGGGEVILDIAGDVLFDSGKVTLKSQAKQTLDSIASTLNSRYSGRLIRVAGHTDSDPIRKSQWKTNERLSAERALAVEEYLASKGVSASRMYVAGFGSAYPKGSKAQSRRVEIVIMNEPAS